MRSMLFAPANHPKYNARVFEMGADAAILDLEDAVAVSEKPAARTSAREALARPRRCLAYVRVNALETEFALGDIQAVVCADLDGIVLPKVQSAEDVAIADWLVTKLEAERGLKPGAIDILPIVETARGVMRVDEIAQFRSRVRRLAFGAGDYVNDAGIEWTAGEEEMLHARSKIAIASRAADLEPPIDTAHIEVADLTGLRNAAQRARRLGFDGKFCIHPPQVAIVNEVFTPTEAAVEKARAICTAFREAERQGSAAVRMPDGSFVDYPIAYRAEKLLRKAEGVLRQDTGAA